MAESIDFFFDPICPWAWRASRFITATAAVEGFNVTWRFFSLRMLNEDRDYRSFPAGYESRHRFGLSLLRIAASIRQTHGNEGVGAFYTACGSTLHEQDGPGSLAEAELRSIVIQAGRTDHLDTATRSDHDELIRSETESAILRAGPDLGTPVITLDPPNGPSFFGPVLTEVPGEDVRAATWASIVQLANLPSFAELKRTRRPAPKVEARAAARHDPVT